MVLFDFANKRTKAKGVKHTKQLLSALLRHSKPVQKQEGGQGGRDRRRDTCKRNGEVNMEGMEGEE